jgi:general secretion pathway protein K
VVDWRDVDGDVSEGGAESGEYAEAEVGYAPSNLPFHSVEELSFLLRLSRADFDRLAPYLTVFSGKAKVDPLAASETVLRAIPGATRNDVLQVLRARRSGLDRARILERVQTISSFLLEQSSSVYRIGVTVRLANGYSDSREAVISASQGEGGGADYRIVAWSPRIPDTSD